MFYSAQVTRAATFLYGLHFPLVIVSALLLWYTNKILYRRYTYSMIACSYICLLVYIIAPSAPPWYTGAAIDLLHVQATTTATTATAAVAVDPGPIAPSLWTTLVNVGGLFESDKFAAFPSLHAAYAALFCYFTLKARRVYGIIAVPVTIGILFSTIYLGQHFLIDLVAGVGLAVSCALLVSKCSTARTGLKNSNTIKTESRLVRNMKKEEVLLC
jgi:membrane-associated phospholipid phosphatase